MINVTAKVTVLKDTSTALKGFATIVIANNFLVSGLKIMSGKNGLFVSMPSKKNEKDGTWLDTCYPITKEFREQISKEILAKYTELVGDVTVREVLARTATQEDDFPF